MVGARVPRARHPRHPIPVGARVPRARQRVRSPASAFLVTYSTPNRSVAARIPLPPEAPMLFPSTSLRISLSAHYSPSAAESYTITSQLRIRQRDQPAAQPTPLHPRIDSRDLDKPFSGANSRNFHDKVFFIQLQIIVIFDTLPGVFACLLSLLSTQASRSRFRACRLFQAALACLFLSPSMYNLLSVTTQNTATLPPDECLRTASSTNFRFGSAKILSNITHCQLLQSLLETSLW